MMNFKKNQNNAVCSMDCKNCPNGASQPNPMDDPKFEKSIALLHNWVMLEAIREDHPKECIVMVILPGDGGELLTEAGSRDIFEDVYDEMKADLVADGELFLHYQGDHKLPGNIRVVGCWAHARRKFDEALQTLPKEAQKNSPAAMGERYCSRLFKLGQALAELTPEERHKKRLEQEKPVLDALLSWANEMQAKTAPKS